MSVSTVITEAYHKAAFEHHVPVRLYEIELTSDAKLSTCCYIVFLPWHGHWLRQQQHGSDRLNAA